MGYSDINFGNDLISQQNRLAMQNAAFQKFFRTWHSFMMTGDIYAHYEHNSGSAYSTGPTCIHLSGQSELRQRWDVASHESGHSYKDQLLGHNDPSYCPTDLHKGYCSYNDQCATSEGWAEFVAMRTWYPDSKDASHPVYFTTTKEYEIEPGGFALPGDPRSAADCGSYACSSLNSACYAKIEMMAARAFWDIWDNHVDNLDNADTTTDWHYMSRIWYDFPSGSCNEGCQDEDDKNMRDYHDNSDSISSDLYWDIWRVFDANQTAMVGQVWP
jgi:hypothetical protein